MLDALAQIRLDDLDAMLGHETAEVALLWSRWKRAAGPIISRLRRSWARRRADVSESVRPYVKAQKNDDRDAEGIAEAATRPTMRFVGLKSQEPLDMQTLQRSRDRLVGERTALINQVARSFGARNRGA